MKLLDAAIKLILTKAYTKHELALALESQFGSLPNLDEAINNVINYLSSNGLIHDRRIALDLCERYHHKGNQFLRHLLTLRKINVKDIEEVLESLPNEKIRAWQLTVLDFVPQLPPNKQRGEQTNHLARLLSGRQFHPNTINYVVEKIEKLGYVSNRAFPVRYENQSSRCS